MSKPPEGLDLKFNTEPVCPHCGHHQRDAWEINFGDSMEGSAEIECGACDEPFFVEREVTVTYTTAKITPKQTA